ncbi:unnamed protein product [Prorocentrum cordatum]|uniref:Uncharacterized protein n=1 Tax=Prorocentrum cordatum TaxID=2364126 RepID=A0ABN9UEL5_9DINO|nr:unnamed protein product [Polarella glacialis]
MASFKAFEPSDAMVKAMEARFAARHASDMAGVGPAAAGAPATPSPAVIRAPVHSAAFAVSAASAASPPFRVAEASTAARPASVASSAAPSATSFAVSGGEGAGGRFTVGPGAPLHQAAASRSPAAAPQRFASSTPPLAPAGRPPREGGYAAHSAAFAGSDDWMRAACHAPSSRPLQGVCEGEEERRPPLASEGDPPSLAQPLALSDEPAASPVAEQALVPVAVRAAEPGRAVYAEVQIDDQPLLNLPSAVTIGGVPVASDGDLVYLGGGLYAAASAKPKHPPPVPRRGARDRILPGRVRPLPPRPLGRGAAARSASANILRPRCPSAAPSRAQSDGELGDHRSGPSGGLTSARPSSRGSAASAPKRVWRPSGPSRLPQPPEAPSEGLRTGRMTPGSAVGPPTAAQGRVEHRQAARRESGLGLFGPSGVLHQLSEAQVHAAIAEEDLQERRAAPAGPPQNGAQRRAEREAAKEARVQALLEERAARLEREAEMARAKKEMARVAALQTGHQASHPGLAASASAPALPVVGLLGGEGGQKQRVACQMEILKFFDGYSGSAGAKSLSAEQTQKLLAKLHSANASAAASARDPEPPQHSIHGRLQEMSDQCGAIFTDLDL